MEGVLDIQKRLWAEIDLDALIHNFKVIRGHTKEGTKICCAVKANAYGLGSVKLAALYSELGADMLAVAGIEEALELRQNGIGLPILILGFTPASCAAVLSKYNISQCIYSKEYAASLSSEAQKAGVRVKSHIKIDSGMGRLGFVVRPDTDNSYLEEIYQCALYYGLDIEGIFTHFCISDGGNRGEEFTRRQFECFKRAFTYLEAKGISFKYRHCANSAAIFDYPEYHLDMVRAGIALYGPAPSYELKNSADTVEALTLRSVISHIKTVKSGDSISYGRTYTAEGERRIASVPIGYADGLSRSLSGGKLFFTVCGKPAPIVGRICMDQTMIDVTDIPEAAPFTEISVYGKDALMSAAQVADAMGTISYEVLTSIARRVPRVYKAGGKTVFTDDELVEYPEKI